MVIPADWIAHTRGDGEIIGYVEMAGDQFRPYDLLGRPVGDFGDWEAAEEALDCIGLSFLADPHLADLPDERRVRITEITRHHIVLVADEFGAAQAAGSLPREQWTLDLPIAIRLRPLR